ncbi:Plug domain-containing protein [Pedobacter ginsengiterrae]|uniref:Plug domain-containing protein n=1 Tax=Pedobacter ginsengiterrae TaxID=871696 RepID=A0ABP7Q504_9SPHI
MESYFKTTVKFLVIIALLVTVSTTNAQENVISKLLVYKKLLEKNQVEKIHLHLNQPFYMAYDTVWFKAYVVNANLNRPSNISKNLNIDLVDPSGNIIRQIKNKLSFGLSDGYINLSDSLKSGNYVLRAYTDQMKSFGQAYEYQKSFQIKGKSEKVNKPLTGNSSFQFFPEGGDLVSGLKTRVGFKATAPNGLAIDAKGQISDEKGKLIGTIKTDHLGMGNFEFTPEAMRRYHAEITFADGKTNKIELPLPKTTGYILNLSTTKDSLLLKISCSADVVNKGTLILIGAQDGVTRYISKPEMKNSAINISIPADKFYSGIVQFTLFDTDNLPVAERLIFVDHEDALKIETDVKSLFAKKELAKMNIILKNQDDKNEIGSLSLSVYNATEYPIEDDDEPSIFSELLLTSDLKGLIEKPNYYFNKPGDENRKQQLDNLLITQGWRKFSWKNELSKKLPLVNELYNIENELKGNVMQTNGKPYANGMITLFQSGLRQTILQTKTDTAGYFSFKDLNLIDTSNFVLSTNTQKEKKNLKITVLGLEVQPVSNRKSIPSGQDFLIEELIATPTENKQLDALFYKSKGINLDEVNVVAKKPGPIKESANLNGPGRADVIVLAKDLETTHDVSTYLLNHVNGLKTFQGKIYSREIPDPGQGIPPPPPPMMVIFDGVEVDQENFNISDINPNDVGSIEILKGTSAGLYNTSGGVIIITSKRGRDHSNDALSKIAKGIFPISVLGYQKYRTFYSPVYNAANLSNKDFRKAVYWNPNVITSTEKATELSFFNSDYTGKYKVVLEGINADGQIGRSVYYYEVK